MKETGIKISQFTIYSYLLSCIPQKKWSPFCIIAKIKDLCFLKKQVN